MQYQLLSHWCDSIRATTLAQYQLLSHWCDSIRAATLAQYQLLSHWCDSVRAATLAQYQLLSHWCDSVRAATLAQYQLWSHWRDSVRAATLVQYQLLSHWCDSIGAATLAQYQLLSHWCDWTRQSWDQTPCCRFRGGGLTASSPNRWCCLLVDPATCYSVSQGWICCDKSTCCHIQIEVADKFSTSPSHSILTLGRPVPALTL